VAPLELRHGYRGAECGSEPYEILSQDTLHGKWVRGISEQSNGEKPQPEQKCNPQKAVEQHPPTRPEFIVIQKNFL
jgi:hypothetical protein